jgi:hypothetical protein
MEKKPLTQIRIPRQTAHETEKKELPRGTLYDVATGTPSDILNGFKYGFAKQFYQPLFSYKDIHITTGRKVSHYTRVGVIDTPEPHVYSVTYQIFKNIGKPIGFILGKLCLGFPYRLNKRRLDSRG